MKQLLVATLVALNTITPVEYSHDVEIKTPNIVINESATLEENIIKSLNENHFAIDKITIEYTNNYTTGMLFRNVNIKYVGASFSNDLAYTFVNTILRTINNTNHSINMINVNGVCLYNGVKYFIEDNLNRVWENM